MTEANLLITLENIIFTFALSPGQEGKMKKRVKTELTPYFHLNLKLFLFQIITDSMAFAKVKQQIEKKNTNIPMSNWHVSNEFYA